MWNLLDSLVLLYSLHKVTKKIHYEGVLYRVHLAHWHELPNATPENPYFWRCQGSYIGNTLSSCRTLPITSKLNFQALPTSLACSTHVFPDSFPEPSETSSTFLVHISFKCSKHGCLLSWTTEIHFCLHSPTNLEFHLFTAICHGSCQPLQDSQREDVKHLMREFFPDLQVFVSVLGGKKPLKQTKQKRRVSFEPIVLFSCFLTSFCGF